MEIFLSLKNKSTVTLANSKTLTQWADQKITHISKYGREKKKERRKDNRGKKRARRGHTALSLHRRIKRFKHAMCVSFLLSFYTTLFLLKNKNKAKKIKLAIVFFSGKFNFQLHIIKIKNKSHKESAVNGPFIAGAKWKAWNLASRKYRDPLEAGMKSVSLASQLCVSIHNPAPKPQPRAAWHSHGVPDH